MGVSRTRRAERVRWSWLYRVVVELHAYARELDREDARTLQVKTAGLPVPHNRLERSVLDGLLAEIRERVDARRPAPSRPDARGRLTRSMRARDLIDAHYDERLTLNRIARHVGCSRTQLTREFRATYQQSIHQYLTGTRARQAIRLLRGSDGKVESVAFMVGYRSKKDLYRAVRAATGLTPRRVRVTATAAEARRA